MKIQELCKVRTIKKTKLKTPLLVPSFSSKGHPNVGELYKTCSETLVDHYLVSAYDIYCKAINIEDMISPQLLIVDSGGYETNKYFNHFDVGVRKSEPEEWCNDLYKQEITKIQKSKKFDFINIVSLDEIGEKFEEQIEQALNLFSCYANLIHTFLCRSEQKFREKKRKIIDINIKKLMIHTDFFHNFDIIGFPEKELGCSLEERCKKLIHLRKSLNEEGLDIPIHMFGCFDPLSIIIYFFCGADMFDGLSWLRYSYHNGLGIYANQAAILKDLYHRDDGYLYKQIIRDNINCIFLLEKKLKNFTEINDPMSLGNCILESYLTKIIRFVEDLNIKF